MTNPHLTHLYFLLDRSGSMNSIVEDTVGGFDAFIAEQQKTPGECRVTLAQFANHYDVVYADRPIADVPALELQPRGSTALLDAMGRSITDVTAPAVTDIMAELRRILRLSARLLVGGVRAASRAVSPRAATRR